MLQHGFPIFLHEKASVISLAMHILSRLCGMLVERVLKIKAVSKDKAHPSYITFMDLFTTQKLIFFLFLCNINVSFKHSVSNLKG